MKKLLLLKLLLFLIIPFGKAQKRKREPQVGAASFYADKLHGRRTSSGERYDRRALTAAHRTLPLGSRVRVTNPKNGKVVIVRINDRGPHLASRLIDLSPAAARRLGLAPKGCPQVQMEVMGNIEWADSASMPYLALVRTGEAQTFSPEGAAANPKGYGLQVSAYRSWENALCQVESIREAGYTEVFLQVTRKAGASLYRVLVGEFASRSEAMEQKKALAISGFTAIPMLHPES